MPQRREIRIRRVYDDDDRSGEDYRVLVDRLWPRGITKADAALDEWLKDVAPSTELRRWYGHDVGRFREFANRYRAELRRPPASAAVDRLVEIARTKTVTVLTATRDVEYSGARVLEAHINRCAKRSHRRAPARALQTAKVGSG
ncbi:MAG: DUF488 family protein [Acidimicrobiales bacterium]